MFPTILESCLNISKWIGNLFNSFISSLIKDFSYVFCVVHKVLHTSSPVLFCPNVRKDFNTDLCEADESYTLCTVSTNNTSSTNFTSCTKMQLLWRIEWLIFTRKSIGYLTLDEIVLRLLPSNCAWLWQSKWPSCYMVCEAPLLQ